MVKCNANAWSSEVQFPGNEVIEQLLNHRSVRAFTTQPLPERTIESSITAAQSVSTFSNLQVRSVVAVQDADSKKRLSEIAGDQTRVYQPPVPPAWLEGLPRISRIVEQQGVEFEALP